MDNAYETVLMADQQPKKRSWGRMILNFLLFGGWILVIGVGLVTAIVLDMYVF